MTGVTSRPWSYSAARDSGVDSTRATSRAILAAISAAVPINSPAGRYKASMMAVMFVYCNTAIRKT